MFPQSPSKTCLLLKLWLKEQVVEPPAQACCPAPMALCRGGGLVCDRGQTQGQARLDYFFFVQEASTGPPSLLSVRICNIRCRLINRECLNEVSTTYKLQGHSHHMPLWKKRCRRYEGHPASTVNQIGSATVGFWAHQ